MSPLSAISFAATADPTVVSAGHVAADHRSRAQAASRAGILHDLGRWFRSSFSLFDGQTGEPIELAAEHRRIEWATRAELCREVARRQRPETIDENDPWLMLAIPLPSSDERPLVAVGVLLSRRPGDDRDAERLASLLGAGAAETAKWIARQTPGEAELLERLALLAHEKLAAESRVDQLESEVEKLSAHLGSTFEEISLLYRLTHNLKLSANDEELGRRAMGWLAEVVPADSIALQLIPIGDTDPHVSGSRSQPLLLTLGACPLSADDFTSLVEELELHAQSRPVVVNHLPQETFGWRFPEIRELVIVPVAEGERLFGWLAVFNHSLGGEFGTAEASLLGSVGTMLGIHSGNIDLYRQQADLLAGVVKAMSSAIDAKDPYTRGHSDRVARVAVRLAEELGCDSETIKTIYLSGLLHDIGKIGINEDVLRKTGKLTSQEFEHIKTHVVVGYRILADLPNMSDVRPVVLHHHEAWDGGGYPHGLAREEIPYLARIVAVADSYDAMASDRPYRPGMSDANLDEILRTGSGKQWDPKVVEAFFRARDDIREISGRNVS
ncbi:MAG TPA: HD domain-containing phosphohydrolase [Pirellulales bacterium]|nr:HD domain-containing phosphohydrolase [Pirellulales bacterium]